MKLLCVALYLWHCYVSLRFVISFCGVVLWCGYVVWLRCVAEKQVEESETEMKVNVCELKESFF